MLKTTPHIPLTEGIKYAGSKRKLLSSILSIIDGLPVRSVFDGFSGSTRVSQALAGSGYHTTANDVAVWSETFAKAYLLNKKPAAAYKKLIAHLNAIKPVDGWFTKNYGGNEKDAGKKPFQQKNTRKLDAVRAEIDRLGLDEIEKAVALTSLILALDSVDNTLGHYAAYLSGWSSRSHKDLLLHVPKVFVSKGNNTVVRDDVFETVKNRQFDLAYYDPPYGSNNEKMPPSRVRYAAYYHIWTTVILNDQPKLFGAANRREDSRDGIAASVFEDYRKNEEGRFVALDAIRQLIAATSARYVLLSYSSGGRATKEELLSILNTEGRLLKAVEMDYRHNVMASMRWTNEWVNSDRKHQEYLFLLEKG